jgi:hypothetical protein
VVRQVFDKSPVFQHMFSLPREQGTAADGSDDAHPLKIEGVKMDDFRLFVRVAAASE